MAIGVAVLGTWIVSANAKAGWGDRHHDHGHHHHGHHHHGHYHHGWGHHHHRGVYAPSIFGSSFYGSSLGAWGWPSYGLGRSYTSLSIGIGLPGYTLDYPRRYPYIYPGSLSSYDYYFARPSVLAYPAVSSYYAAPYYSSYSSYSPRYAVPYTSSHYASSACCAPVPASACCDPCAGLPIDVAPSTSTPSYTPDSYTPDTVPAVPADPSSASGDVAPSVRALPNWLPSSNLTRSGQAGGAGQGRGAVTGALLTTIGRDSVQSVSVAKPVMPEIATTLMPLSKSLLQAADAVFAAGEYQQAAAAYARLTIRYGNHDELAVRRFIALVASGDCEQAAVMYEAASLAEQPLLTSALPAGGLVELYGAAAPAREQHADYLAAYALQHPDDGLALAMVGTWLQLDGQSERAQLFMQRAAALAPADRLPTRSEHLVATDISQ